MYEVDIDWIPCEYNYDYSWKLLPGRWMISSHEFKVNANNLIKIKVKIYITVKILKLRLSRVQPDFSQIRMNWNSDLFVTGNPSKRSILLYWHWNIVNIQISKEKWEDLGATLGNWESWVKTNMISVCLGTTLKLETRCALTDSHRKQIWNGQCRDLKEDQ